MRKYSRVYGPIAGIILFVTAVVTAIILNRHLFPWFNPAGVVASDERTIFFIVLGLSAIVVLPVFTLLFVFALRYREGNHKANYQPEWSKNAKLEIAWWGIPILIIITVGSISWYSTHLLDPYRSIPSDVKPVNVQVVALQWKWLFIYPDEHVATINRLELPVNTPISLSLSADAPMSAFWVPSLGSQIYTMNGMSTKLHLMATKTGTFSGYNTNVNGKGYAKMDFEVPVVSKQDFATWAKQARTSPNTMNEAEYKKLVVPSVAAQPKEYALTDGELYDTIVMKYMAPMNGSGSAKPDQKPTDTHNMNMMEGM